MSTRNVNFVPLTEVPSYVLNNFQEASLSQRADGAANTMPSGLDVTSPAHHARVIVFSSSGTYTPPLTGLLDSAIDWRDRQLNVQIAFDPVRDIRWAEGGDLLQPEYEWNFSVYSNLGGQVFLLDPKRSIGLYVSIGNGVLYLLKTIPGFIRGEIRCTCQLKSRLP